MAGVSHNETFDFIVVGAGSAGSAVTGRLVEAGHKVLLVEAGGPPHYLQKVPSTSGLFMIQNTLYGWPYITTPQEMLKGYKGPKSGGGQMKITHGKTLGGSSNQNYMHYVRGNPRDYDEWADLGNAGWGWKDVLPFFIKSEKLHNDQNLDYETHIDQDMHGREGRQHVMPGCKLPRGSQIVSDAAEDLGYQYGDYNGHSGDKEIIYRGQTTQKNGFRADAYSSYISDPGLDKNPNLKVLTHSLVRKVILDKNQRAIGIELERFGEVLSYYVSKEVILSAGAIGSPKILMLSGIGPEDILKKVGVKPVLSLKGVGTNVQDHLMMFLDFVSKNESVSKPYVHLLNEPINLAKYALLDRKGPSCNYGIEAGLFVRSDFQRENGDRYDRPDIQMHSFPFITSVDYGRGWEVTHNIKPERYTGLFNIGKENDLEKYDGVMMMPTLLRPKSRGTIRLASKNPKDLPLIDPRYMTHPDDIETLAAGARLAYSFQDTPTFKANQLEPVVDRVFCGNHTVGSHEYFKCLALHHVTTVWHYIGSCKMGSKTDPMAVVDASLRVHGIHGLRVIDASIMPTLVGGNTNAPSIMVGEKGADIVISDWKKVSDIKARITKPQKAKSEL